MDNLPFRTSFLLTRFNFKICSYVILEKGKKSQELPWLFHRKTK